MTNVPPNGPLVTDLARRLQRVEDKLDERIATVDMLNAQEKLFIARELTYTATQQAHDSRIARLEVTNSKLLVGVVLLFLGLLISILTQLLSAAGRAG